VTVCLRAVDGSLQWGGFDFLINYDVSMLSLVEAQPGAFLVDCEWEYFTYRIEMGQGGGGGFVRLVGIADMNNSNVHPACLAPDAGDAIACLTFRTTNDWTLACLDAPIQFWWNDCGDNTISNPTGDTLFVASGAPGSVVTYDGFDLTGQAGVGGPPGQCPSDKTEPLPCTQFCSGKVRIICPGEIDLRADINLNNLAYEISDAVLYSLYFIQGPGVFTVNSDGQIAASDVNADGVALTVADLVYLIRVITGDEQPIPENGLGGFKVGGIAGTIEITTEQRGTYTSVHTKSEHDVGAALFVFNVRGTYVQSVAVSGRSSGMDMSYEIRGDELRVLLFNINDRARIAAGEGDVLTITTRDASPVSLVSVEAATFNGASLETDVSARVVPASFALHQNYPNPFNPATSMSIDFPTASEYALTVYNVAGQIVKTFSGHAPAGTLNLVWDGRSDAGGSVASGVYFYAVEAGEYADVRKMILMK